MRFVLTLAIVALAALALWAAATSPTRSEAALWVIAAALVVVVELLRQIRDGLTPRQIVDHARVELTDDEIKALTRPH